MLNASYPLNTGYSGTPMDGDMDGGSASLPNTPLLLSGAQPTWHICQNWKDLLPL